MEISQFTTTVLRASEGHKLTQVDESISVMNRKVVSVVCIGKNGNAANWKEITKEEASAILTAQEQIRKAEEDQRRAELNSHAPEGTEPPVEEVEPELGEIEPINE